MKLEKAKLAKYSVGALVVFCALLIFSFGTLSPCGIASKMALGRMMEFLENDKELKDNPFGGLGVAMGMNLVRNTFDAMSPPRCAYSAVRMAFGGGFNEAETNPARKEEKEPVKESGKEHSSDQEQSEDATNPVGWQLKTDKSPIDDSETVILTLNSEEPVHESAFRKYHPTLVLRCKENETDVYVAVQDMIKPEHDSNFNEYASAVVRYDSEKAEERDFDISPNNHAIFFRKPVKEIDFMKNHEKMLIRYQPYGDSPVTVSFHLKGLSEYTDHLKNACHWKE